MANNAVMIKLQLENTELSRKLAQMERQFKKTSTTIGKDAESMGNAVGLAIRRMIVPAAVIAGLAKAGQAIISTAKAVADLNDQAQSLGVSFQNFQVLEFAAVQSGTSIDKVTAALSKMESVLGNVDPNTVSVFDEIGLSAERLKTLSLDEQFVAVAKALQGVEDPAKRAAYSVELFGRGYRELNPLIKAAAGGLDEFKASMAAAGIGIDDVTKNKLAEFDDAWEKLKLRGRTIRADFFTPVASYFTEILDPALDANLSAWERLTRAMEQTFVLGAKVRSTGPSNDPINFDEAIQRARDARNGVVTADALFSGGRAGGVGDIKLKSEAVGKEAGTAFIEAFSEGIEFGLPNALSILEEGLNRPNLFTDFAPLVETAIAPVEKLGNAFTDLNDFFEANTGEDVVAGYFDAVANGAASAFIAIASGTEGAKEAVLQLIESLAQLALQLLLVEGLKRAFGNLGIPGFSGGASGASAANVRVFSYGAAPGGIQTRTLTNGDVEVIIGQVATAIQRGGNVLNDTIVRTYGLGRVGR